MPLTIDPEDLKFAKRVDELGQRGLSQDQIARALGMTRHQVRYRLERAHCEWNVESRVRYGPLGNERIEDLLERGEIVAATGTADSAA